MKFITASLLASSVGFASGATEPSVTWYQTAQQTGDKLTLQQALAFSSSPDSTTSSSSFTLDPTKKFQQILGFGGALTQSSASVYNKLPTNLKETIIEAYYGPTGIGYSTGRLPIHSCDFSPETYTFDDAPNDVNLDQFDDSIAYDQNLSLPLIHDALAASPDLKLFGSPWSPPAWMKDNNNMEEGGQLLDSFADTWANYFSRWIASYDNNGVHIWGVTVQNEPEAAQSWESCIYTPETMRDFVAYHLGPTLQNDHPEVKILGFDHNKDHLVDWANTLMADGSASQSFIDGVAFHWYSGKFNMR
jgi:glucosylceramidase